VEDTGGFANVREEIGFIPWYFNLPGKGYEKAWKQVSETDGFLAPFGITTAERRSPEFRTHGCCNCEWDGAVWPFATSQTLTGLANLLNNYKQNVVNDSVYFDLLETYVESQYYRGRPYIGEYLDETTGYWLKGDQERSRYYNHSTFNDLIISGLIGLRPRSDNTIEINPLLPENKWDWFCLDNVLYHSKIITVIWDKTGEKYHFGKGMTILVDGKVAGKSEKLGWITGEL
ncbi:MAG TPA: glycosyl hydrolase family 65 protein, partial [Draconibacterium sp.]|nr:glycosyl hydrolase family 65 protein [Draconibacterium sp.]